MNYIRRSVGGKVENGNFLSRGKKTIEGVLIFEVVFGVRSTLRVKGLSYNNYIRTKHQFI